VERKSSDDVAVADVPSMSGAHWANRDNDTVYRKAGARSTTFRRPPALNSFPDDIQTEKLAPSEYLPADQPDLPATGWFAGQADGPGEPGPRQPEAKAPEYGPAPPASPGRASFGLTAGPIAPSHGRSATAPASPAPGTSHQAGAAHEARAGRGTGEWPAVRTGERPAVRVDRAATDGRPEKGRSSRKEARKEARKDERERAADEAAGIGDLTGSGREIRPHRAARGAHDHTPPRGTPSVAVAPQRRSRTGMVATIVLVAVLLFGVTVGGVVFFSGSDKNLTSVLKLGAGDKPGKIATAPLDGRSTAAFDLVAATDKVTVRTEDLGDDLYRMSAAGGSGVLPSPVLSQDEVQLMLTANGAGNTDAGNVDVVLSSKVRWSLRFTAGGDEQIVNLTGGQVARIDVLGASRRFELSLPKPVGTVPVRVTGAIEDFSVKSPVGAPVRIQLGSGAKTVAAGQRTLRDVRAGSTLTPKNWQVQNRYDIDAAARVTLLSVENAG
jgi:hypothetical protein